MSAYSLVASDYDLTLAALPGGRMTQRVIDTLCTLQEMGVPIAIASGRGPAGIEHNLALHHIDPTGFYYCGYNGAEIVEASSGTHIASSRLDGTLARSVFDVIHEYPVEAMAHLHGRVYSAHPEGFHAQVDAKSNGLQLFPIDAEGVAALRPSKFLVAGEPEDLHSVEQRLRGEFGAAIEVVFSADFLLEVNAAGTDKGWGLRALAEAVGVPIAETVAFGDNFNDIPLIQAAGLGVAMGNAVHDLLEAADRIAPSCYDDGFATVVDELFGED
jgi:Cof subfamily protein (haloacid dehalogenase superfamily)